MKKSSRKNFLVKYYFHQRQHHDSYGKDPEKMRHAETWLLENTIDAWRHNRMYKVIDPFLGYYKKATWLTIGDSRYGKDAHYIEERGGEVLATDISIALLKEARNSGFIKDFKRENAEGLSFKDESFDFVFCKESYHHFPRPTIALYEMLRVAKKAVILIEPNDAPSKLQSIIINFSKKGNTSFKRGYFNSFEESGNYVYKISEREIEKIALGIGLQYLAFNGLDDYYLQGVEYKNVNTPTFLFFKIKTILALLDILYKLKLRERSLLTAVIFKNEPKQRLKKNLIKSGYRLITLPDNPYRNL